MTPEEHEHWSEVARARNAAVVRGDMPHLNPLELESGYTAEDARWDAAIAAGERDAEA